MGAGRYLKILTPLALIVLVVFSGFVNDMEQPTVAAVNGTVSLFAEIGYAVFAGACNYEQSIQEKAPISWSELRQMRNALSNDSATAARIRNACEEAAYVLTNANPNDIASYEVAYTALLQFYTLLCKYVNSAGGSCSWVGANFPEFSVSIPLSIITIGYIATANVTLNNKLPLAIDKVTGNEANGTKTVDMESKEPSCARDCSFTVKIESYSYNVEPSTPITISLEIFTNSAVVWGFPFWWIRIGTTAKTITATLEVNLSNSTVRLLA